MDDSKCSRAKLIFCVAEAQEKEVGEWLKCSRAKLIFCVAEAQGKEVGEWLSKSREE